MPRLTAASALRDLRQLNNPRRARMSLRYFKTGPGQYGEGDRFLGLTMPALRALTKRYHDLPPSEIDRLFASPWHEARLMAAVILAHRYPRADAATQEKIYRQYLRRADRLNNWDLVDISAPQVVGGHLLRRSRAPLRKLAKSKSLWERRIAIVSTLMLIKHGQFDDTLALALLLRRDPHDLIHKATGWALREVGKRDVRALTPFLDRHAGELPRTTLRYALERLSPAQRKRYMAAPRLSSAR